MEASAGGIAAVSIRKGYVKEEVSLFRILQANPRRELGFGGKGDGSIFISLSALTYQYLLLTQDK